MELPNAIVTLECPHCKLSVLKDGKEDDHQCFKIERAVRKKLTEEIIIKESSSVSTRISEPSIKNNRDLEEEKVPLP